MLEIVVTYLYMQYQEKLVNQTSENDRKLSFRPDFGMFSSEFGPKKFFSGF